MKYIKSTYNEPKVKNPYTMRDFYEFYMDEVSGNPLYEVDRSIFYELIDRYISEMMDYVLLKSGTFRFPYRLGFIRVIKRKVKPDVLGKHNIDWPKTREIGKIVYQLNEHTNYYKYLFQWDKDKSIIDNLYHYRFPLARRNKRRLAKLIKSGEYDYYEKY